MTDSNFLSDSHSLFVDPDGGRHGADEPEELVVLRHPERGGPRHFPGV